MHFGAPVKAWNQVVDRAYRNQAHPAKRAGMHVTDGPVGIVRQGIDGLDRHHRPLEGRHAVEGQRHDQKLEDGILAQFVPGTRQGHHAVDHAAPRGCEQNEREHHAERLRPVGQRGVVQVMRAGPHIGENQRPEMHHRQSVGIDRAAGLLGNEVVHHAEKAGGQEKAHRVMPVPPLHHGVLHPGVGRVGFPQTHRHRGAVDHVQQGNGQDKRAEKPVRHIYVRRLALGDSAEEHNGVGDPHQGD